LVGWSVVGAGWFAWLVGLVGWLVAWLVGWFGGLGGLLDGWLTESDSLPGINSAAPAYCWLISLSVIAAIIVGLCLFCLHKSTLDPW